MHEAEIVFDCKQTVDCLNQMGEPLPEDPFVNCQQTSAEMLDADSQRQNTFLLKVSNCANFVACDYYFCARAEPVNFGEMQKANIMYDCAQQIQCMVDQGTVVNDYNMALSSCVDTNIMLLNQATADVQNSYRQAFPTCQTLASCEFINCFRPPSN